MFKSSLQKAKLYKSYQVFLKFLFLKKAAKKCYFIIIHLNITFMSITVINLFKHFMIFNYFHKHTLF